MDINAVNNQTTTYQTTESTKKASETRTDTTASADKKNDTGVVYEKSKQDNTKTDSTKKIYNADLVAKLKSDAEERTSQLRSLVEKMMTKQGAVIASASSDSDSMWRFLAKGNFTDENGNSLLTADEIAKAKEDISDDGYWGVEQTSDRILDFAKALSGNDTSKAELLLNAFKKGYQAATKSWGEELPDISKRTYDAVLEKFEKWKNESGDSSTTTDTTASA